MQIRVTLKDPDTMQDAVDEAYEEAPKPDGISEDEWSDICTDRAAAAKAAITANWMRYGEYLEVLFDTEAGTATVIPVKDARD